MSHDPVSFGADAKALLKGGAALSVVGASLVQGTAAEAGNKAQKEQAEALKAAAAARAAVSQPAALSTADHYTRAKMLLAGGDVPGAMAAFRRVLAEEPRSVDAMNGLGVTYDRMGRHDVARGWYEAALSVAPDDGAVLANLGYSLTLQDEWRAAIPWLQAATRSTDAAAAQTARRLLARVNAALTAQRARAPVFARPAEIALSVPAPVAAPAGTGAAPGQTRLAQAPAPVVTAQLVAAPAVAAKSAPAPEAGPETAPETAPETMVAEAAVQPAAVVQSAAPAATAVGAHIEFAANGEARLVLGRARAPAPALVASLGDAATLVLVPRAPVVVKAAERPAPAVMLADATRAPVEAPRAQVRKVRARKAAAMRSEFQQALVMVEAPIARLSLAASPEITLVPALVAAREASDALAGAMLASAEAAAPAIAGGSAIAARPAIVRQAVARVAAAASAEAAAQSASAAPIDVMQFALAPEALATGSAMAAPVLTAAPRGAADGLAFGPAIGNPDSPYANPAWLLHIRRAGPDGRTAPSAPALALTAADAPGARQFDSDDDDLNRFAARLRGPAVPGADLHSPAARQAAIARLEAVIVRARHRAA